jgi:hypothetical protein
MVLVEYLLHRLLLRSHIGPRPVRHTDLAGHVRKAALLLKQIRLLSPSRPPRRRIRASELSNTAIARYVVPDGFLRMGKTPTRQYVSRALVASVCSHMFPAELIHITIAHASRASAPVARVSPVLPVTRRATRASMDNFHPLHPANPAVAVRHTAQEDVEGTRLRSRFPAMICHMLHLHPEVQAAALEGKTPVCLELPMEATSRMIHMGSPHRSSLVDHMTAPRRWDVPCAAVTILISQVPVMIHVTHVDRAHPHDHPARRIIIDASRG